MDSQDDSQASQDSVMTVIDENRHEVLYFAYGSNLSTAQMRQRCPFSTPIGLGYMEGWRWIISQRGYANVVRLPSPSSQQSQPEEQLADANDDGNGDGGRGVYGLLYLLPPQDEERLDGYEGVPWAYEKFQCDVRWVRDGEGRVLDEPVRALVYVDEKRTEEDAPREEYVGRMETGIEDAMSNWGLDERYANEVMRRFWTGK